MVSCLCSRVRSWGIWAMSAASTDGTPSMSFSLTFAFLWMGPFRVVVPLLTCTGEVPESTGSQDCGACLHHSVPTVLVLKPMSLQNSHQLLGPLPRWLVRAEMAGMRDAKLMCAQVLGLLVLLRDPINHLTYPMRGEVVLSFYWCGHWNRRGARFSRSHNWQIMAFESIARDGQVHDLSTTCPLQFKSSVLGPGPPSRTQLLVRTASGG